MTEMDGATTVKPAPRAANLTARVASAMVALPVLFFLVFFSGGARWAGLVFTGGVAVATLIGGFEFFRAARQQGYRPAEWAGYLCLLLLPFAAWGFSRGQGPVWLPVVLSLLILGVLIYRVNRPNDGTRTGPTADAAITLLGVAYVGSLFAYTVLLHGLPGRIAVPLPFVTLPETPRGAWMLLYVLAVTWSSDSGAFFIGRRWGKHPLAPRVSPGKTREGAVGGILGGLLMSLLWGTWVGIPLIHCLILGVLLGALAQVGDLCESALKRDFGVKDFGSLMPGHGGILDRFDSVLLTAPVTYYYLVFFLPTS